MAKTTKPAKRIGFFANLPWSTISDINARVTPKKKQWQVIVDAIKATKPKRAKK